MSKSKSPFVKALLKLNSASEATKRRIDYEYQIFKELYSKSLADKSLSKKTIMSQMQKHFKRQNLKLGRSKFFDFQKKIQEEELKKDWWVTKRMAELRKKSEEQRTQGAKKLIMIIIDPKGQDREEFIKAKSKEVTDGIKKGSQIGAKATKKKFI